MCVKLHNTVQLESYVVCTLFILSSCWLFTVWHGSSVLQEVEHRLVWCPYIPSSDDDYDQEDSTTVAVVHGEQVRKILFSLIHNSHVVAWSKPA